MGGSRGVAFSIVPQHKSVTIVVKNCEVLHLKLANIRKRCAGVAKSRCEQPGPRDSPV